MAEESATEKELLRLLQLDLDITTRFIERISGVGVTVRGWAITVFLALLGFAFDRGLWQLGALSVFVSLMFGYVDAYYLWVYGQALNHARAIDRVFIRYYAKLTRGQEDEAVIEEFNARLEGHTFGLTANLLRFQFKGLWYVVRTNNVLAFYLLQLILAAAAIVVLVFDP